MPVIKFTETPLPDAQIIYRRYDEEAEKLKIIQLFTLVSVKPHEARDGRATNILKWRSNCTECGVLFRFTTGMETRGFLRRCRECRRNNPRQAQWPSGPRIQQEYRPAGFRPPAKPPRPIAEEDVDPSSLF